MICCICGKEIEKLKDPTTGKVVWEQGNDPWPVKNEGRCCGKCDMDVVLPARMKL